MGVRIRRESHAQLIFDLINKVQFGVFFVEHILTMSDRCSDSSHRPPSSLYQDDAIILSAQFAGVCH